MKIFLFKTQDKAPEYIVRMKDGGEWSDCGFGTKKISGKGTVYLEADFKVENKTLPVDTLVPDFSQEEIDAEIEFNSL